MENQTKLGENCDARDMVSDKSRTTGKPVDKSPAFIESLLHFDVWLTDTMAICAQENSTYGNLRPVMKFMEYSAHGIPWIFVTLAGIIASHQIAFQEKLINLLLAMIVDLAVVCIIKAITRRKRPAMNEMDMFGTVSVDKYSFPSGHTTRAAMTAFFFIDHFCSSTGCCVMIAVWSASVSLSRILLGRHHVLDVICGIGIGIFVYQQILPNIWIQKDVCEKIVRPLQEHIHL